MALSTDFEAQRLLKAGRDFLTWFYPAPTRRVAASATLRVLLRDAQGGLCAYCGVIMQRPEPTIGRGRARANGDRETLEHVYPIGFGGYDGPGNVVLTHHKCNHIKAARHPTPVQLDALERVNNSLGWTTKHVTYTSGYRSQGA